MRRKSCPQCGKHLEGEQFFSTKILQRSTPNSLIRSSSGIPNLANSLNKDQSLDLNNNNNNNVNKNLLDVKNENSQKMNENNNNENNNNENNLEKWKEVLSFPGPSEPVNFWSTKVRSKIFIEKNQKFSPVGFYFGRITKNERKK
jgi:hypothetical protein